MIDKHSETWKEIEAFVEAHHTEALQNLIDDNDSEQQRGAIRVLESLKAMAEPTTETKTVVQSY